MMCIKEASCHPPLNCENSTADGKFPIQGSVNQEATGAYCLGLNALNATTSVRHTRRHCIGVK